MISSYEILTCEILILGFLKKVGNTRHNAFYFAEPLEKITAASQYIDNFTNIF